ncbi:MAG: hypothetical protein N2038_14975 [Geminicoccaceae bacterium]|nr:hypothetical protein [Geminicoccaceae bacterium]
MREGARDPALREGTRRPLPLFGRAALLEEQKSDEAEATLATNRDEVEDALQVSAPVRQLY